jgi:CRISPR-associated protein Cas2
MKDGFVMLQFSVYIRHCASKESQEVHIKRVKSIVPETGMVSMLSVTDCIIRPIPVQFPEVLQGTGEA